MTDDEFTSLVTRYLEDALGEKEQQALNRELLDSPERVRLFNDLRLLAGMIVEHGRTEGGENPEIAVFPKPRANRSARGRWLAAAAILVIGLFLGIFLNGQRTSEVEASRISFDFEQPDSETLVEGFPKAPGHWSGDRIEFVSKEKSAVPPSVGDWAACLTLKPPPEPVVPEPKPAVQWRIVDLPDTDRPKKKPDVAELCVQFNRDADVPDPDLPCRVELYSFRGSPDTAESQLGSEDFLAAAITHFRPDSDPQTWESAKTKLPVAPDADFLLLGISGFGQRIALPAGGEKFTGHYADGVELKLFKFNNQSENTN